MAHGDEYDPWVENLRKNSAKDELHGRVRTIDSQIVRLDDEATAAERQAKSARLQIEELGRIRAEYAAIIRGVA